MAANSHGARSLARMAKEVAGAARVVVSVAKGLEPDTGHRVSEVYAQELAADVVAVGGPCLAAELAEGLPTAAVWAAASADVARSAGEIVEGPRYQIAYTDDVAGVEYCSMMKNVAAIGLGILDGLGKPLSERYTNAKAALFTKAAHELSELVTALGGRPETALGLAGIGDQLVTSLGGRNRLYGELVGDGSPPRRTLEELEARGLTVEGVDSTRDVHRLAGEALQLDHRAAAELQDLLHAHRRAAELDRHRQREVEQHRQRHLAARRRLGQELGELGLRAGRRDRIL
jgi:glycerol-3-phosphate dehydrogenase (NAD(P)+)